MTHVETQPIAKTMRLSLSPSLHQAVKRYADERNLTLPDSVAEILAFFFANTNPENRNQRTIISILNRKIEEAEKAANSAQGKAVLKRDNVRAAWEKVSKDDRHLFEPGGHFENKGPKFLMGEFGSLANLTYAKWREEAWAAELEAEQKLLELEELLDRRERFLLRLAREQVQTGDDQ